MPVAAYSAANWRACCSHPTPLPPLPRLQALSNQEEARQEEQQRQLQEQQQLFEAIEQCVQQAEELEAGDKLTEAINLVQTGALAQLV